MLNQVQRPRRFWKQAVVCSSKGGGYGVELDGRPLRVPSGFPLRISSSSLADAIAGEWNGQGDVLEPFSMPMTRLANTAIDRTAPLRPALIAELMDHVHGDALFYHADSPSDLVMLQAERWNPLLDWVSGILGVCCPRVTAGLMPLQQDDAYVQAMGRAVGALDDDTLTVFQVVAAGCGSLVLALAFVCSRIDATVAFELSLLDELYQASLWGEDAEAACRRVALRDDLEQAAGYLALVRAG